MVNIKVIDVANANANAAVADADANANANAAVADADANANANAGADVIKKIIISNEANLKKDDLLNSSLLNYGAQYSLILTYYPRRNIT
jgi:ornithine cyclodeaminase/alanine dehydrogenase-like protein (mu-crystallin family)